MAVTTIVGITYCADPAFTSVIQSTLDDLKAGKIVGRAVLEFESERA